MFSDEINIHNTAFTVGMARRKGTGSGYRATQQENISQQVDPSCSRCRDHTKSEFLNDMFE